MLFYSMQASREPCIPFAHLVWSVTVSDIEKLLIGLNPKKHEYPPAETLSVRLSPEFGYKVMEPLVKLFPKATTTNISKEALKLLYLVAAGDGVLTFDGKQYNLNDLINMNALQKTSKDKSVA